MGLLRPVRDRIAGGLDKRFGSVEDRFAELRALLVEEKTRRVAAERELKRQIEDLGRNMERAHGELSAVVKLIASEEPRNRRALWELRSAADYEEPFSADEPLVSICITTVPERTELLMNRALPSALNQTYENIEVVIVGDHAGTATHSAITALNDPRVSFTELTVRFKHPDPNRGWYTNAVLPRNEALRKARGLWTTELDDDDALKPDAVASLLELAQDTHVEVAYGKMVQIEPGGGRTVLGAFPPKVHDPDWRARGKAYPPWQGTACAAALNHRGLKLFKREFVAADLGIPGDFFRLERMVQAGVSFGMLDRAVYDYYPSKLWT